MLSVCLLLIYAHIALLLFQLSDKQYIWVALIALLKLRRWQQVEALFQTKVICVTSTLTVRGSI